MTPTFCPTCGAALDGPEMSALAFAHYVRQIPEAKTVPALSELARDIVERFPDDVVTPSLTRVIALKIGRLTRLTKSQRIRFSGVWLEPIS